MLEGHKQDPLVLLSTTSMGISGRVLPFGAEDYLTRIII